MKRWIAALLTVAMLMSCFPLNVLAESGGPQAAGYSAAAEEAQAQKAAPEMDVETGGMTVEATNSFGKLLLDSMDETNGTAEAGLYDEGNKITGLSVEGTNAWVDFCTTANEADLVVAIYTEDELEMLASGTVEVTAGQTSTLVQLEGDMPDYFVAKAYLLAKEDHAPISPAFSTWLYTEEMVDLSTATVDDFAEDRVINLDDDKTTNFAVVKPNVELVLYNDTAAGSNQITQEDNENLIYTIENATEEFTNLRPGDIIVYEYEEGCLLVVKSENIEVNGDSVIIYGDDSLELTDVFDALKIEAQPNSEEIEYIEGSGEDGVIYLGDDITDYTELEETNAGWHDLFEPREDHITTEASKKFSIYKKAKSLKEDNTELDLAITLDINFSVKADFGFYVWKDRQYVAFVANGAIKGAFTANGALSTHIDLGDFGVSPVPGVYLGFSPQINVRAAIEATASITYSATVGFSYDSETGFENLSKSPSCTLSASVEGTLYVGYDLCPKIKVLGSVLSVSLQAEMGATAKIAAKGHDIEIGETVISRHGCLICFGIDIIGSIDIGTKISFLKLPKLTYSHTFAHVEMPTKGAYWAPEYGDFGWGECPHEKYHVVLSVLTADDASGKPIYSINANGEKTEIGQVSILGETDLFLDEGTYQLVVIVNETVYGNTFTIDTSAVTKVDLAAGFVDIPDKPTEPDKPVKPEEPDPDTPDYDFWEGTLTIYNEAIVMDYSSAEEAPWYDLRDQITKIVVRPGITKIGSFAFADCSNVTYVSMGEVASGGIVTQIDQAAFAGCTALKNVYYAGTTTDWKNVVIESDNDPLLAATIQCLNGEIAGNAGNEGGGDDTTIVASGTCGAQGDNLTWALDSAGTLTIRGTGEMEDFYYYVYDSVPWYSLKDSIVCAEIEDGVTSIGDYAFYGCSSLTEIRIPDGVTSIGEHALRACGSLTEIAIPDSVTSIGAFAFGQCWGLTEIRIPDGVTSIGIAAFDGCSRLKKITIPEGVTSIEMYTFEGCNSLKEITIPEGVTYIGCKAFIGCNSLTKITIPESVTIIDSDAFDGCSRLTDAYYGGTEKQWGEISIRARNRYLTSATIHYNSTSPDDATNSIIDGSSAEDADGWQATFRDLIPNTDYAVIVSLSSEDPLAAGNLQYITQVTADANGNLTVYYRQSDPEAASYVVACGSGKTIVPSNPGVSSGGGSGDGGAAAALLLAGAGAVAAVVVARAVLPVEVSGVVTDETGAPLPGATVAFWQNGAVVQQTVTGETGGYSVKLKKGGYDLAVSYFDPATGTAFQQTVTITAPDKARTVALDLSALKVPAGQA